ncbi:MAG: hypothetical protein CMH31_03890 [Micavibrio sp.]|nr:hypothetical protein [Micavibrio sp.]|tara:strand:- start:68 stop:466 length:399 start_codon:yes stop_codon:yes gene_type:complete
MDDLPTAQRQNPIFSKLIELIKEPTTSQIELESKQGKAQIEFARIVKVNFANNAAKATAALVTSLSETDTTVGMTALSWTKIAEKSPQPLLRDLSPIMSDVVKSLGDYEHVKASQEPTNGQPKVGAPQAIIA